MDKKNLTIKETFALAIQNHQKNNLQVAEQNLDLEEHPKSIQHPLINSLFTKFDGSQYYLKSKSN